MTAPAVPAGVAAEQCAPQPGDADADRPAVAPAGVATERCPAQPGDAEAGRPVAAPAGVAPERCAVQPGDADAERARSCRATGAWVMRGRSQRVRVPIGPPRRPPTAPRPPTRPTRSL